MSNQPQMRMSLENSKPVTCESCGNDTFTEVLYIRKISKLLTGAPEDALVPIPSFACSKCKHVNQEFKVQVPGQSPTPTITT